MALERNNNNGNYALTNCRWATPREQANNTRRNCFVETLQGRMTVAQAARLAGVAPRTIKYRIETGMPPEKILQPAYQVGKRRKSMT